VLTQLFFVPPAAADAIMEAADAGIKVIIAITEGIPVADMIKANAYVKERNARLIGQTVRCYYSGENKSWYHARFCI
jgi:succinyl-CoA synthetase alpha subunit